MILAISIVGLVLVCLVMIIGASFALAGLVSWLIGDPLFGKAAKKKAAEMELARQAERESPMKIVALERRVAELERNALKTPER